MAYIGQGIAFAALAFVAAWLEINGKDANWVWIMLVIWAFGTSWHP